MNSKIYIVSKEIFLLYNKIIKYIETNLLMKRKKLPYKFKIWRLIIITKPKQTFIIYYLQNKLSIQQGVISTNQYSHSRKNKIFQIRIIIIFYSARSKRQIQLTQCLTKPLENKMNYTNKKNFPQLTKKMKNSNA